MKHLIKLFWWLTSDKFLIEELNSNNVLLCEFLLPDKDRKRVVHMLNTYILPEIKRRGL